MIGYLKGNVVRSNVGSLILDVHDVGYKITTAKIYKIGQECTFYIYHHIREDQNNLFGFETQEELECFELLITVSGVGPKMAMTINTSLAPTQIIEAIKNGQPAVFQAISGVGNKVATKIVVELKSKVSGGELDYASLDDKNELLEALLGLGLSRGDIIGAMKSLPKEADTLNKQVKWVLKFIGQR